MELVNAVNIEQSTLCSLTVDDTLSYKLGELNENMFTIEYNKNIFKVMKDLYKDKKSLDIETIYNKLKEKSYGVDISYLSNLVAMSQSYAIDTHIEILSDKNIRRQIIKNCTSLFEGLGEGEDINTVVYKFESRMNYILYNDNVDNISSICANLLDLLENNDKMGIKFGIKFLDDVIGGLFKGELTTIASRSGVGKTDLALQIRVNCMEQGKEVVFISREMRNIIKKTVMSTKDMNNKEISEESWKKIIGVIEEFGREDLVYIIK